jgi:hypothetical protein
MMLKLLVAYTLYHYEAALIWWVLYFIVLWAEKKGAF